MQVCLRSYLPLYKYLVLAQINRLSKSLIRDCHTFNRLNDPSIPDLLLGQSSYQDDIRAMPPWSNRLLPGSSRNELGPSNNATSPSRSSRLTETEILENAYGIPTLPPPPHASYGASNISKPTRTPSHGRSMSHPFPALFSGKKKRTAGSAGGSAYESTDDDVALPYVVPNDGQIPTPKQKVPDKDLMTGKCMTCDSMVRWPKDLKVFRCTVCLTINDLVPVILEARHGDGHRAPVPLKSLGHPIAGASPRGMSTPSSYTYFIILICEQLRP